MTNGNSETEKLSAEGKWIGFRSNFIYIVQFFFYSCIMLYTCHASYVLFIVSDIFIPFLLFLWTELLCRRLEEDMRIAAQARSCTGVLGIHSRARDVKIDNFSITFHGSEMLQDTKLELNCGRRWFEMSFFFNTDYKACDLHCNSQRILMVLLFQCFYVDNWLPYWFLLLKSIWFFLNDSCNENICA